MELPTDVAETPQIPVQRRETTRFAREAAPTGPFGANALRATSAATMVGPSGGLAPPLAQMWCFAPGPGSFAPRALAPSGCRSRSRGVLSLAPAFGSALRGPSGRVVSLARGCSLLVPRPLPRARPAFPLASSFLLRVAGRAAGPWRLLLVAAPALPGSWLRPGLCSPLVSARCASRAVPSGVASPRATWG